MKSIATVFLGLGMSMFLWSAETHTKEPLPEVKKNIDEKKAVLVDVREKGEWDEGHIAGAIFVPLSGLKAGDKIPDDVPKDKPVYLHCKVGARALTAAGILKKAGYDARALKVGVDQLVESGFEKAK